MVTTIGVDSSTTNCGVAIYDKGKLTDTKLFRFKGTYGVEKLREIVKTFDKLFSDYGPDIVLIEEPAPVRHSRAITGLNQVAGAIFACGAIHDAFVDFVHNQTAKRLMKAKSKADALRLASTLWVGDLSEHEADAVLIVEAYKVMTEDGKEV